ncbi:MAG: HlyD family secretion protein [Kangiella sp.]|nr:MAG: HlyD family secretion protein [Kangiella sp.]
MKNLVFCALLLVSFSPFIQSKEIYATFTVHARKTANLAFNYNGIIEKFNVDIMSKVKKGDILATLHSEDLVATNNASEVSLKYAELDFKRHEKLLANKLIDKAQLDKFALAYDSIKAKIEIEKTTFEKTILRAPFDGVITRRLIENGDLVSAQRASTAFIIQSESNRILVAEFDQKYHADVKVGDLFNYNVDGQEQQYQGRIFRIYPTANTDTRKVSVQVIAKDLKVGLFGDGIILTSENTSNKVLESE